jgi:hypothetical protein
VGRTKDLCEIFEINERRWRSGRRIPQLTDDEDLTPPAGSWDIATPSVAVDIADSDDPDEDDDA